MDLASKFAIITLLITYFNRGTNENLNLGFLNKLVQKIEDQVPVETMLILQHSRARDCALQNWNPRNIPTLRFNELDVVLVRKHFNRVAVGLVCICNDTETSLLDNLAKNFNRMRQVRIILWFQTNLTLEMLHGIADQVEELQFFQMLILEVMNEPKETVAVRRLDPFPTAHFNRIDIFELKGPIFYPPNMNFKGRTVYVMPNWGSANKVKATLSSKTFIPIVRVKDYGVLEFISRYNLSLRVVDDSIDGTPSVVPDIQLNTRIHSNLDKLNPFDMSSLMVAVPCGKQWIVEEVFKHLDVHSWLLYIFFVYVIFVLAETFILVVTYRISGKAYRLTSLNPLLNPRAFRAILGMPFPISRSSSLSLRQLFLAISVFGLIFSNFFSCKLSALLIRQSTHPCVENFEDLRASGLNVIVGPTFKPFLDSEAGSEFLKHNLTNVKYVSQIERIRMILSPNGSYAYFMFTENWQVMDMYQKIYGKNWLCTSEGLTIIRGLPMTYIVRNNSILERNLFRFLMRIEENGIMRHWINLVPYTIRKVLSNDMILRDYDQPTKRPLSLSYFTWLWLVLGCGYSLAIIVFLLEIAMGNRNKKSTTERVMEYLF